MFSERILFLQVPILFCILTTASHSTRVHALSVGTASASSGGGSASAAAGGGNDPAQYSRHNFVDVDVAGSSAEGADLEDVDSDRLSNVNRISFSPLLMLPTTMHRGGPQGSVHRAASAANPAADNLHHHQQQLKHVRQQQAAAEEEEAAFLGDMLGDRNRISSSSHRDTLFGEMRVLGNNRHRTPHYGTIATSSHTQEATGGGVDSSSSSGLPARHVPHVNMGYKHQEQFLKPKQAATLVHHVGLPSNEVPSMDAEHLRLLKKRTQDGSSSRSTEQQQSRRLTSEGGNGESLTSSQTAKDQHLQVSKKSGNPFLGDTASLIPHSIASQLMLRSARGQRQYDVPQIGE